MTLNIRGDGAAVNGNGTLQVLGVSALPRDTRTNHRCFAGKANKLPDPHRKVIALGKSAKAGLELTAMQKGIHELASPVA